MNEIAAKINNKNVKFSDAKVEELFELLKSKVQGIYDISPITDRSQWWLPGGQADGVNRSSGYVGKPEYLKHLQQRGLIASTDVNAMLTFLAGNSYDKRCPEERTKWCQTEAKKLLAQANAAMAASADPLFSRLRAEMKNKDVDYCILKKDRTDDGYDLYCCQLWLKISYSK